MSHNANFIEARVTGLHLMEERVTNLTLWRQQLRDFIQSSNLITFPCVMFGSNPLVKFESNPLIIAFAY
jgi:hypothetical protein